MRVAVLGASGFVGSALVETLALEHDVVAVARRKPTLRGAACVAADLTKPEDAERALVGVDVAVHLVHSLGQADYERRDVAIATNVAAAAEACGLTQIVYLGGLGDDADELSSHLRSRHETGLALAGGSVPVTILRAGVIVGRGSAAFETIVALVDRLPAMVCPRWVAVPTQPIALGDVVATIAGVVGMERAYGESYDLGGPEVMTYREMIDGIARVRGKRPLIVEVPVLTPRLSSLWLHLVTPVKASVARPLIDGLRNPTVTKDDRIRELVPVPLTPFERAVREALGSAG
ncbi:MAG TPA: NAD-dependent epimerase/dehydratase family protein [Gaiellaceae bacterium]|nr:NAD-dependent epimerase/dehydratase family protein [Gaiellaceae bacterium]